MPTNQKKLPRNVEDYLSLFPLEVVEKLDKLRQTIRKAAPFAEEVISYQMPAYKFNGMLVWMAGFKNHYSMFVRPKVLSFFKEELKSYETSKSTIKFSFDQPVPVRLVTKIVKHAVKVNLEKAKSKPKK